MKRYISEDELTTLINQLNIESQNETSFSDPISEDSKLYDDNNNEQNGSIQVKDQRIIVRNPFGRGTYPIIKAAERMKLFVNNKEVHSETVVNEKDSIHWEVEEKPLFEITISKDKLFAYFHLHSKQRCPWRLVNQEPSKRLTLTIEEDTYIVLETVRLSDVVTRLEQMSIVAQIDFASIQQELLLPTHQPIIVARGVEPIPGVDAKLELYFSQQVESHFFEVEGSINFRNHLRIPTVNKGDPMAKKIPSVNGTPGYDVLGSVSIPPPPKDVYIETKPSVELTSNGVVIAQMQGRPRITGSKIKTFDVSTSFVINGNMDIETGNIVFSGDVIVHGDVTDNMIIESLGNVYIHGNVYNSTITATGSINVRGNVMASKLYSGYFGVLFNRLYHTTKLLCTHIEKMLNASKLLIQVLESKKQEVRYGQIIMLLLENKMKEIYSLIKELLVVIANIQQIKQDEYAKLKEVSEIFLQPTKLLDMATYNFVQSYLALLKDTHQEVARMQEAHVNISINQCHKSELKSNGDIIIHRDGVLVSDLYSARNIVFLDDNGVCRGSRLDAGDSIVAKVIGGQTGVMSVLKAKKKVSVLKMYSGRVCVGRYCRDIFDAIGATDFDFDFDSMSMKEVELIAPITDR
ncbi:MAG: FapA family protein [Paenibacillaceae bacterium]